MSHSADTLRIDTSLLHGKRGVRDRRFAKTRLRLLFICKHYEALGIRTLMGIYTAHYLDSGYLGR